MTIYSRWTLRSIPELVPFSQAERVRLWKRAAKAAVQEHWVGYGVLMGLMGSFGGRIGSNMEHALVGSALGGMASAVVVMLLTMEPIRRRLNYEILKLRRGTD